MTTPAIPDHPIRPEESGPSAGDSSAAEAGRGTQFDRYARQRQFAPIGPEGQRQISSSCVAVLGCGALGTVAAEILARAGVGSLRIIDRDVVEWTNLQRQSLFEEQDAEQGVAKAAAATDRLSRINRSIEIVPFVADVTADNMNDLLSGSELVIDATDNFPVRMLLNDWSLATQTPWVHGGCVGGGGQVMLFTGLGAPCFRCLVPEVPPPGAVATCDTAGVIGSATHLIASLQATEAIKWLSGNRDAVRRSVLALDLWENRVREIELSPRLSESCAACGKREYDYLQGDRRVTADGAATLCGRDAVQLSGKSGTRLDLPRIAESWRGIGRVQSTRFFARLFPTDQHSLTLFRDGRAVITGTQDIAEARSIYDRYVGQ